MSPLRNCVELWTSLPNSSRVSGEWASPRTASMFCSTSAGGGFVAKNRTGFWQSVGAFSLGRGIALAASSSSLVSTGIPSSSPFFFLGTRLRPVLSSKLIS
eukprot:33224_6